jgi:hydroxyacylglutathione hydrolase
VKIWITRNGQKVTRILGGRSNVFLVTSGEKNLLVDTSTGRLWKKLDRRLKSLRIKSLNFLVLTHTHFDHAENAHRLKTCYNARVIVHKEEANDILSGGNWTVSGTNAFTLLLVKTFRKVLTGKLAFPPCQPDLLVDEKLDLTPMGFRAFLMHTPGHTPGSMSIIVDDEIALVGDCMFGIFKGSVFPPFASDIRQMIGSWRKLLETGCTLFLPSHGTANSREIVQHDYDKRKQDT